MELQIRVETSTLPTIKKILERKSYQDVILVSSSPATNSNYTYIKLSVHSPTDIFLLGKVTAQQQMEDILNDKIEK